MTPTHLDISTLTTAEAKTVVQHVRQDEDVYGDVWGTETPQAEPLGLERFMVQQDKLFVVVAVVLVIWLGIAFFLMRTDRRIARLEERLEHDAP